ncbi:hypothetical protein Pla8534_14260 [Lignipirellula cremea]|uniref:Uncharacterized protein n=1 Tax=Lignipirellula cremea TaxID=2528010 RepID=A0A518DP90_9BACT|nr:hypothetical protein Pla8534_14260 [Lignipirellula cremea]
MKASFIDYFRTGVLGACTPGSPRQEIEKLLGAPPFWDLHDVRNAGKITSVFFSTGTTKPEQPKPADPVSRTR